MMLKPSIDVLLDKVDSKYSLVVLEAKRAHELRDGEAATQSFSSVKPTLQALEELAEGNVSIHPAPEAKRTALKEKRELERLRKIDEERKIKEQIAKEQAEEEAKQRKDKGVTEKVTAGTPVVAVVETPEAPAAVEVDADAE
ncbi:DNA-directed RNA polymerase subunit omega [Lactococcus chungangensis CAU 28 = DSM 22330]|uniref:DNA-directed RNA polymerase subunit omega n=1 Tax=Pseudolactococcus chungangensis CAU 28 = DSM 22330 TaxID=1122154 RepID=A0A1K2HBI3_9LACT|nr:DNA-directed RNA polymerase subunit omega [Bacilli bacterium]PCS04894.1 DNA-directed RNA polymerase subunit omega [Lactococcus chungangensis CAU 28 = DSM 22330]SFZ74053.1 DNA-directed RNA polymerase subunit omega [Lactococcus chungangensis CAU 28 = DSM 22330]